MRKDADYYRHIFEEGMDSELDIYTQDGKLKLEITDGERWKQCYKKGDKAREQLPPFWFISDRGNLISVAKNKLYLLNKFENNGRYSYHFIIGDIGNDDTYTKKNIPLHDLVRIVFGGLSYGKADELLQKEGVYAFGQKHSTELKLNGHHIADKEDNSPANIEFVSTSAHIAIDKTSAKNKNMKAIGKSLAKVASEEAPNSITLLSTGEKCNAQTGEVVEDDGSRAIHETNRLQFKKKAVDEIKLLQIEYTRAWMIEQVPTILLAEFGADFFNQERLICTNHYGYSFYTIQNKKAKDKKEELEIKELDDIRMIADKGYYYFALANDGELNYYGYVDMEAKENA